MTDQTTKKGVKTKIFGVLLIFLGVLDCMLSWRGGFRVSGFYTLLILAGVFLFIIGSIRQSEGKQGQ